MTGTANMTVSDSAIKRIGVMREKQGNPELKLRVTVFGGGCSGFKYELVFDDKTVADDLIFGDVVVTDPSSLPFLQDAIIDYEQTLMGSAFKIKNPNAASGCGCGKSFSVKM